jgi:hypothetical protein
MSVKVGLRAPKSKITPPEVVETVLPTPLLNHVVPAGLPEFVRAMAEVGTDMMRLDESVCAKDVSERCEITAARCAIARDHVDTLRARYIFEASSKDSGRGSVPRTLDGSWMKNITVVLSAVQFAAAAKSLESSRWLEEVADKDLVDGLGDGIEGSLAVFVELRMNACVADADWEVCVLDLGFKITDLGNVAAFVDPESDCCDELLFSETVLEFVRNKGPKDRKNILPRSSNRRCVVVKCGVLAWRHRSHFWCRRAYETLSQLPQLHERAATSLIRLLESLEGALTARGCCEKHASVSLT